MDRFKLRKLLRSHLRTIRRVVFERVHTTVVIS